MRAWQKQSGLVAVLALSASLVGVGAWTQLQGGATTVAPD